MSGAGHILGVTLVSCFTVDFAVAAGFEGVVDLLMFGRKVHSLSKEDIAIWALLCSFAFSQRCSSSANWAGRRATREDL